jgi:hypothetical protein
MNTKIFFTLALLLIGIGAFSQITSLASGTAPSPAGTERLLAQRHKGLRTAGASSDKEVYVGVPDLGTASNRAESDLSYSIIVHFNLQYSPIANSVTTVTNINSVVTTTTKTNISSVAAAAGKTIPLSQMNFMELQVRTQNATSAIDVSNLIINGQSITGTYTRANSPGSSYWHLLNYDFGSGFTMTGTITLTGTFGSSTEANKVEFTFGSQPAASPLPVVWGDISVRKNVSGNNELRWTTLEEQNAESFLIQRSENGRTFQTIGRKAAQGNSTTATNYTFEDVAFSKDAYYRLIQVDIDGTPTYSRIVSIKGKAVSNVVYNGSNSLLVQSSDRSAKNLRVIDPSGRMMLQATVKDVSATIDISSLSKGVYFVQVEGTDGAALRFFKQ